MKNRLLLLLPLLTLATSAVASQGMCPTERDLGALHAFSARLASAHDVDEAKALASKKVKLGHKAIDQASRMLPNDPGIAAAQAEFELFEATVAAASTTEEVASAFDALATDSKVAQCDFTTTEIVIIVIGFVLGILPGVIFLLIFC